MASLDIDTLKAALVGYQQQRDQIAAKIDEIRRLIGGAPAPAAAKNAPTAATGRRTMSAAARRRIAAAQKKRWAAYHAEQGVPAKKKAKTGKRKLSPEGRQRIIDALKKRWAASKKVSAA
jgi:peptidoglycan hydrolase CwlO-like protein